MPRRFGLVLVLALLVGSVSLRAEAQAPAGAPATPAPPGAPAAQAPAGSPAAQAPAGTPAAQAPTSAPVTPVSAGPIYVMTFFEVVAPGAGRAANLLRQFAMATRKA